MSELVTNARFMPPQHRKTVIWGMLHAEKMAKKPSGKYAWSPKLREVGLLLARYWHLVQLGEAKKIQFQCSVGSVDATHSVSYHSF